jgi:hypothetical protein
VDLTDYSVVCVFASGVQQFLGVLKFSVPLRDESNMRPPPAFAAAAATAFAAAAAAAAAGIGLLVAQCQG